MPPQRTAKAGRRGDRAAGVSLPVLPEEKAGTTRIARSRNAPKRAIVLIIVQALIILHIVQWLITGTTTTPVEPSEAMEFGRSGIINVGLIFFAVALLSTLILGRWFCGWGCHVILLQDCCAWMMKKCGIRPKPFRSRLLVYVPLILAAYMFLWPAFLRLVIAPYVPELHGRLVPWEMETELITSEFWATFPGVMVAIPFLFVCGFAAVYFLGAKGFCTYGCPYGGFFAPLDRHARGRIRVTDACEGCGHCTAVCTSNVRVHEEVRDFKMVVDPGCMKCLDCVSVCPKEALYFGFGPAPPKEAKLPAAKRSVQYDLSWPEEIILAIAFLVIFLAWRGAYGLIPALMAIGIAGCVTFLTWKLWRLLRDANVTFHRHRLRKHGRFTAGGWMFSAAATLALAATIQIGFVEASYNLADRADDRVTVPLDVAFGLGDGEISEAQRAHARAGLRGYRWASEVRAGGIGWPSPRQPIIDRRRAWLLAVIGSHEEAESVLERSKRDYGPTEPLMEGLFLAALGQGETERAYVLAEKTLREHRTYHDLLSRAVQHMVENGEINRGMKLCRERLDAFPDDARTMGLLALLKLERGEAAAARSRLERAREAEPEYAGAYILLSMVDLQRGEVQAATQTLLAGLEHNPKSLPLLEQLVDLLHRTGRRDQAAAYEQRVEEAREAARRDRLGRTRGVAE